MRPKRTKTACTDAPRPVVAGVLRTAGSLFGVVAVALILLVLQSRQSCAATSGSPDPPAATSSTIGQESPEPTGPPAPEPETPTLPQPEDDDGDDGGEPPVMEPPPIVPPDSLRAKPVLPAPGGAPLETLVVMPKNVLGTKGKPAVAPPKKKGTPFGIHPIAIFAVLIVGHVFLVRAVTD